MKKGFSLLEMLAAMAVFALMMAVAFGLISQASSLSTNVKGRAEAFTSAQTAFEAMARNLSQATLNTYWDYDPPFSFTGTGYEPSRYIRKSELHFISGRAEQLIPQRSGATGDAVFFQMPMGYTRNASLRGLNEMLNNVGYFVEFGSDQEILPDFVGTGGARQRYRLKEFREPAESTKIYQKSGNTWFTDALAANAPRPLYLAENIVAIYLRPKISQSSSGDLTPYTESNIYDSHAGAKSNPQPVAAHQLPPVVELTMVALDEASANRLNNQPLPFALPKLTDRSDAGYSALLANLRALLDGARLNYRIYSTDIAIGSAKWSP